MINLDVAADFDVISEIVEWPSKDIFLSHGFEFFYFYWILSQASAATYVNDGRFHSYCELCQEYTGRGGGLSFITGKPLAESRRFLFRSFPFDQPARIFLLVMAMERTYY